MGGVAQRSADVVAEPDRAHPRRDRRRLTAARPAGGDVRVPRVAGESVQRRVGVDAQTEVGQVRPGERDRTGGAHPLDGRRSRSARSSRRASARRRWSACRRRRCSPSPCTARRAVGRALHRLATAASARSAASERLVGRGGGRWRSRLPFTCSTRARCASTHLPTRDLLAGDLSRQFQCPQLPQLRHAAHHGALMHRWIIGARPRTLPAAVVPVALGATRCRRCRRRRVVAGRPRARREPGPAGRA